MLATPFLLFLFALLAVGAAGFSPAAVPATKLAQSKVVGAEVAPTPVVARSSEAQMSAVTERDADGNPVTHFEMFDPVWLGITLTPWLALLVTNPF